MIRFDRHGRKSGSGRVWAISADLGRGQLSTACTEANDKVGVEWQIDSFGSEGSVLGLEVTGADVNKMAPVRSETTGGVCG